MERAERKAEAAGVAFDKQRARGKQHGEHIIRRQREAERRRAPAPPAPPPWDQRNKLSAKDKSYARRIGRELGKRSIDPEDEEGFTEAGRQGIADMQRMGPELFREHVRRQRALVADYIASGRPSRSYGMDTIDEAQGDDGFSDEKWYFYR
jgi:hypothetical protein